MRQGHRPNQTQITYTTVMTNGGHEEYTLAEGIAQNKSINLESGYIWGVSDVIIDRQ